MEDRVVLQSFDWQTLIEMKKYQGKLEKTSSQSFRKKSKKPIDNKKTI